MAENTTPAANEIDSFEKAFAATDLPEPALAPIKVKVDEAIQLITENNKRVAQINAAKASDPNNVEVLDSLWKNNEKDPKISATVKKFYAVAEEYEKLNQQLRDFARENLIPEVLSEEDQKKTRQLVNESAATITTASAGAQAMLSVVDSILESKGKGIPGGVASLLPQADSLKNARGRKAGSSSSTPYATRVFDITFDGESTQNADGKTNFNVASDILSKKLGADTFSDNRVTKEELEQAFYDKLGKEFRSLKSAEPGSATEFDFTKEIKTGENKSETKTVKVIVKGQPSEKDEKEVKAQEKEMESQASSEAKEVPAPAKKAAAPAPKK